MTTSNAQSDGGLLGPYALDTIHAGECSELMAALSAGCIDLTVTSPPYDNLRDYNGYEFPFEAIAEQLYRVTKQGGVVVWVVADATIDGSETGTSFRQALHFMELGFNLHDTMIYRTAKPPMNDNRYQACFEYMFVLGKGHVKTFNPLTVPTKHAGERANGTYWNPDGTMKSRYHTKPVAEEKPRENIWRIVERPGIGHPAPFPSALARDHIRSWSNPGDIVLDPMCGSGTTLKMAHENGRRFIGFDISEEYCELARRRVRGARTPLPMGELL